LRIAWPCQTGDFPSGKPLLSPFGLYDFGRMQTKRTVTSTSIADSGDCGQGFRLNATMQSDRRRPPVPTKATGVSLPA
jgi:hypothetical protein